MLNQSIKNGFSLIEICMVLIILSIITCFIYPNYQNIITKAHRVDGKLALIDLALRMDQYFTTHNTYETATIGTQKTSDILSNAISPQGWYTLAINHATKNTFTVQATPTAKQVDPLCNTFTINQYGHKSLLPLTTKQIVLNCWDP